VLPQLSNLGMSFSFLASKTEDFNQCNGKEQKLQLPEVPIAGTKHVYIYIYMQTYIYTYTCKHIYICSRYSHQISFVVFEYKFDDIPEHAPEHVHAGSPNVHR